MSRRHRKSNANRFWKAGAGGGTALVALLVLTGCSSDNDGSAACTSLSTRDTLTEPPTLSSQNGQLDITLEASPFTGSIALSNCTIGGLPPDHPVDCSFGPAAGAFSYSGVANGSSMHVGGIPGPTLVVEQGDALKILLRNNMPAVDPQPVDHMLMGCSAEPTDCITKCSNDLCPMPETTYDPNSTNVHTHGLHVSPGTYAEVVAGVASTADNIYVSVPPAGTHQYDYGKLAEDHPTGMYWYHPHNHMTTNPQVAAGLAGAILVKGSIDTLLKQKLPCLKDRTLVFQSPIPASSTMNVDPVWIINGQDMPTLTIRPGEVQRWRVLNASSGSELYLALAQELGTCLSQQPGTSFGTATQPNAFEIDCDLGGTAVPAGTLNVIGVDGVPLSRPVQEGLPGITLLEDMSFIDTPPPGKHTSQEGCPGNDLKYQAGYLLPPGKRMELLVQFDKHTAPGTYKLVTRGLSTNPFQTDYGREIANVVVEGAPVSDMVVPDQLLPPEAFGLADLRAKSPASTHCLAFGIAASPPPPPPPPPGPPDFVINDQNFCPAMPLTEGKAQTPLCTTLGDTDQWDIVNTTADTHPFHIHVNPFQVTQMNGVQISPPECSPAVLEDTVSLPVAQDQQNPPAAECNESTLQTAGFSFRTKYTDFTGDPVFHCHILLHEDGSMMGRFTISDR